MNRIAPVKSQEELQADIICLKRQLTLALDENQLLKVKARRLKDELRRKDKHMECLTGDPQKVDTIVQDRQLGRFSCEGGASAIYKLQKRNAELEDMILERDLNDEKRYKDLRTVCLYTQSMDGQAKKKGFMSSMQSIARLKSCPRSESPSVNSLGKINTSAKRGRIRSLDSSLQSVKSPRVTNNCYFTNSTGDCPNVQKRNEDDNKISSVFKTLELEKILEKRALQIKNAEISRLSAELREIKDLLGQQQECERLTKSTSTTQIRDRLEAIATDFVEENERDVIHSHVKYINSKLSRTTNDECSENDGIVEDKKLSTLHEQNEETIPTKSPETSSDVQDKNCRDSSSSRPKTRIEYVYDSEVSSDGEEFSLSSNLTSFLQQAVNAQSSGNATDNNSE